MKPVSCEHYWREGIVLVERGLTDPHRDSCEDCLRAHASRQELIDALPLIGADYLGDPHWQAKVWQRIDREPAPRPWRWRWHFEGALIVACAVALWIGLGHPHREDGTVASEEGTVASDVPPRIEIFHGDEAMRSRTTVIGDHLQITVGETSDVWIYHGGQLLQACRARHASNGCAPDLRGTFVDVELSSSGTYDVIITKMPVAPPRGTLDKDRAALESARVPYEEHQIPVY
jgi:hypothetical protein